MRQLRAWLLRFKGLFVKSARERELADEIEGHLQMHIDDNLRQGMSPVEARRVAVMKLGGVDQAKEAYRDRATIPFLESAVQDLRFTLRQLRKHPAFTVTATTMVALGVVGLYGVIAYSVSQRTREIGVRIALGAQRRTVYQLILKEAGVLALAGIVIGTGCAILAASLMRKLLFGTPPWDITTLVCVAVVLGASALMASFLRGAKGSIGRSHLRTARGINGVCCACDVKCSLPEVNTPDERAKAQQAIAH